MLAVSCKSNKTEEHTKKISFCNSTVTIDGLLSEPAWKNITWQDIDQKWLGPDYTATDFSGRYKLAWNENKLLVAAEIQDDKLIDTHADGLYKYWDDDCLEIFIDEDASGGDHQYNYNAFAYHIGLDNKVVDIGLDSLPHYYNHITCVRHTSGNISTWELSIDIYDDSYLYGKDPQKVKLSNNKMIGFAIAYCDNDNSLERENFIGSAPVAGDDKNRGWIDAGIFEKHRLVK